MATIYYTDGRSEERQPANGHDFELKELQQIVGGYIEILPMKDGRIMVCNEESKLEGLPRNEQATALIDFPSPDEIRAMLAARNDIIYVGDPDEQDYVAGDVLVCESSEVK